MTRKVLNELKNAKILFLTKNKIPPSLVLIWKNAQLSLIQPACFCALRALGLLLADDAPTVRWGKTF